MRSLVRSSEEAVVNADLSLCLHLLVHSLLYLLIHLHSTSTPSSTPSFTSSSTSSSTSTPHFRTPCRHIYGHIPQSTTDSCFGSFFLNSQAFPQFGSSSDRLHVSKHGCQTCARGLPPGGHFSYRPVDRQPSPLELPDRWGERKGNRFQICCRGFPQIITNINIQPN